jgi:hypothetical protein
LVDEAAAPLEIKNGTDIKTMIKPIQRIYSFLNLVSLVAVIGGLIGCAPNSVTQNAVASYKSVTSQISIGDQRDYVLAILQTNQQRIPAHFRRSPERYLSYGDQVEIHFVRTGLDSSGSNYDDDFTPYVFKNDVLVSVGWTYVSKTEFLDKAREAISAGGVKQDQDVVGDRR